MILRREKNKLMIIKIKERTRKEEYNEIFGDYII